jgi:hypothetical protein
MNTIDGALIEAIAASSAKTTTPKRRCGLQLIAVSFGDDDEPVRATADKSQYVMFTPYLNTRAAVAA